MRLRSGTPRVLSVGTCCREMGVEVQSNTELIICEVWKCIEITSVESKLDTLALVHRVKG